jgi:hypothetical protein
MTVDEEKNLLREVADWLAEEGYPWTANKLRDGSWRKGSAPVRTSESVVQKSDAKRDSQQEHEDDLGIVTGIAFHHDHLRLALSTRSRGLGRRIV